MFAKPPAFTPLVAITTVLLGAVGCGDDGQSPAAPSLQQGDVFVGGQDGYPKYRIPAMIETPSGALLAFSEGRRDLQDTGNIDIVMKRSVDGGATWSPLGVVIDNGSDTAGNPAPVVDKRTGTILLPYNTNPTNADNVRSVMVVRSDDDGLSWSAPTDITNATKKPEWGWYATGPGRSIQLATGRIVVPCDHRDTTDGSSRSHVIWSDDGIAWHLGGSLGPDTDESQVAELEDGSLVINMRDLSTEHRRAVARSQDGGQTWSETERDAALPDSSCQGSLLQTPHGLVFSNPDSEAAMIRQRLTVRLSKDGGRTWPISKVLREGPSAYSALASLPDGRLGCLYENGDLGPLLPYDRLTFASFSVEWLTQ